MAASDAGSNEAEAGRWLIAAVGAAGAGSKPDARRGPLAETNGIGRDGGAGDRCRGGGVSSLSETTAHSCAFVGTNDADNVRLFLRLSSSSRADPRRRADGHLLSELECRAAGSV